MATQTSGDETKAGAKKRLARAKVKRDAKPEAAKAMSEAARAKERKSKIRNVIIAIFAVVIAISMMLPSLSGIVNNNQDAGNEQQQEATDETKETDEDSSEKTGMEKVDENYTTTIEPLEAKLKENPEDLATLLSLGNDYMSWGYAASAESTDEASQAHVDDLFKKAIDYFDQYLKLNDSVDVKVSRAQCVFYSDSHDAGIEAMTKLTEENPEHAAVWVNLALLYEQNYDSEKAQEIYKKVLTFEADDNYTKNMKSYASSRLTSLNSSKVETPSDTLTSTTPTDIGTESGSSLTDTLLSESKTSF